MGWKFWQREKSAAEQRLEDLQHETSAASADPSAGAASGFELPVEDVFSITGRGTVITGQVRLGAVNVGQQVQINKPTGASLTTTVTGIEMFRKIVDTATAGDNVGLLLRGVKHDQVGRGDVVTG